MADLVEVTRCKDCEHYEVTYQGEVSRRTCGYCNYWEWGEEPNLVDDDDYCSNAERRKDR